jgi:hypothetical protein
LGRDADEPNDYEVAPSEGQSLAELNQQLRPLDTVVAEEESQTPEAKPPLRFSLRDLLLTFTFASVGLAAVRWLPAGYFAGLAGLVAFLALVAIGFGQPKGQFTRLVLWGVLTIYLFAAIGTLVIRVRGGEMPAAPPAPAPVTPNNTALAPEGSDVQNSILPATDLPDG